MKINFGAGPAALPNVALLRAREDLVDFEGSGLSVVEQSHRGAAYERVHAAAISLLRSLIAVPDTHEILLLQGGARGQFAMLPLNLMKPGAPGDYVVTGVWSRAAYDEAALVGHARIAADTREVDGSYRRVPRPSELCIDPHAAYLHICSNNTACGTQWSEFPDTGAVPLIADMTSDILSRAIDVSRFGMIYAAAQKNLGPSGVVAVIIRKDLIERSRRDIPTVFRYAIHAQHASLYYTPATFSVATMRHVLEHASAIGGIAAIEAANREKARRLYGALDARPELYRLPAARCSRSLMNVTFHLPTTESDARFLAEAGRRGMVGLKGHRTAGGIRASIYNWVSLEDVDALVDLIAGFEATHVDASTQTHVIPASPDRVLLLEVQSFLREIYSQEVRNWAELRDEGPLEIVALDDPAAWLEEVARARATVGIMDVDGLPMPGLDLYHRVRAKDISAALPLIVLGSPANIEPLSAVSDELMRCLRKPVDFGILMNTVRVLAKNHDD